MESYDLCLAWSWEHDQDFVTLLDAACRSHDVSLLQITPENLGDLTHSIINQQVAFRVFLDRASDSDESFLPVVRWACNHAQYYLNPYERAAQSRDKSNMQPALSRCGFHTPYTVIIPPYQEQPVLSTIDLRPLGARFTIKPACGGGGEGVVNDANSVGEVLSARQDRPAEKYLLESRVVPAQLGTQRAWFRVIYCTGRVYPSWWDPATHVYIPVQWEEQNSLVFRRLHDMTISIARASELDFFSTEICLAQDGRFVVVDYVNDMIDLRLQSRTYDGVPDDMVCDLVERLAVLTAAHCDHALSRKSQCDLSRQVGQTDDVCHGGRGSGNRLEHILQAFGMKFQHLALYERSGLDFSKHTLFRVASCDMVPDFRVPFVYVSASPHMMSLSEVDFVSTVQRGIEICWQILQRPPAETKDYQGMIYLDKIIWFNYQGSERRSWPDRRQQARCEGNRGDSPSTGPFLDGGEVGQISNQAELDSHGLGRRKGSRRTRDHRITAIPQWVVD
jgi:hypothetical protein